MSTQIRTPSERTCHDCGREEHWDEELANWRVSNEHLGNVNCIHDWDITGTFTPVEE
jgi:hypothetical protein